MLTAITSLLSLSGILLTLITLFLIYIILIPYFKIQSRKNANAVTYYFPVLGLLRYWMKNLDKHDDVMGEAKTAFEAAPHHKYMLTNIGRRLVIILRDPQYVKEYLLNQQYYHKSPGMDFFKLLIGNGLVAAEDETWKRHRKIISSSFHFEFLKNNIEVIQKTTREFLDSVTLEEKQEYHAISKLQEITGEIVGRIFFGENLNSYTFEGKTLCLALADITTELGHCAKTPPVVLFGIKALKSPLVPRFRRIVKRVENFRALCLKIIEDRKAKPQQSNDLLASLLATQKSDDPEKRFSDEEIVNEFLTFFVGGMDTTGHLLGMTLYLLTQHPEYLEKLREEREAYYNKEAVITSEALQKMDVLQAFLKESLRFYTPGPTTFIRIALADHKVLDLPVKKGDLITPEYIAAAWDDRHFEEPKKFNPERWRGAESGKTDPYAFIPFSAGPRNCIGQHLAMIESKIIVSEFLNRFDFKLKEGYKLRMLIRFLYEPETDVTLCLTPK